MLRRSKSGFTLVEILIVVIILGILAAIVIPQFTSASQDARRSNLASTVQTLRGQVALYKMQHNDVVPDLSANWNLLLTATKPDGTAGVIGTDLGPYMQATPRNPFMAGLAGESTVTAANYSAAPPAADGTSGFFMDTVTGKMWSQAPDPANPANWVIVGD